MAGEAPEASGVESALEAAFGDLPVEKPAPVAQPEEVVSEPEAEEALAPEGVVEGDEAVEEPEQEAAPEPEFELEVDGEHHTVRGADQVKELLQKGLHYGKKSNALARQAEAMAAREEAMNLREQFSQQIAGDVAELRALDNQLDQYSKIDWNAAFESDPFKALQLKEQRDQLREQRSAKLGELNQKHEAFKAGQAKAAQQMLASEHAALLEKIPDWRNAEKAAAEKQEIARVLTERYGFTPAELNISDHRALVIMREHVRMLKAQDSAKSKQVRTAPPVVKPGVAVKANPKAEFAKTRGLIKAHGQKGNHRAQEAMVTELLSKTFKI